MNCALQGLWRVPQLYEENMYFSSSLHTILSSKYLHNTPIVWPTNCFRHIDLKLTVPALKFQKTYIFFWMIPNIFWWFPLWESIIYFLIAKVMKIHCIQYHLASWLSLFKEEKSHFLTYLLKCLKESMLQVYHFYKLI